MAFVYVGTYQEGIFSGHFDAGAGKLAALTLAARVENPSFLAVHPNRRWLYAVSEIRHFKNTPSGAVHAFSIDPETGQLRQLNVISSRGAIPCHLAVDGSGGHVLVANYAGATVAVFRIGGDGRLEEEPSALVRHAGSSVHPARQKSAHPHAVCLSPDNRFALVPDLGMDQVVVYEFDTAAGSLTRRHSIVSTHPGAGPRHIVFDAGGRQAWLVNELRSTVTVFAYDAAGGALREIQTIPALPASFHGENIAAGIVAHPAGKFLYVSNRGHDSIAVFARDESDGTLRALGHAGAGGKTPRHLEIDPAGGYLLAANQDSNQVRVFHVHPETGVLTPTGEAIEVASPACVKLAVSA
jgi:6-phosphogluconolactonase